MQPKRLAKDRGEEKTGRVYLIWLKFGTADVEHCVGSVTTLGGNISGLPPASLLRYRPGIAHLYSSCKRKLLCWLSLQDLLSLTQQTTDHWVSPFSVQALLFHHPCISWAAIAAAGQALLRAFHPFPSRSERDELWHEEHYGLRRGIARENTFNVLPYSSSHKRGNIYSVHGPCGSVFSLSEPEVDPFEKWVKANSLFSPAAVLL